MKNNKGICSACVNDSHCTFPRRFPVWQCEEYSNNGPTKKVIKKGVVSRKRLVIWK